MKPGLSEFSYGYAVTDELVHELPGISAAPVFPSLYQEGQPGGGYDVMIRAGAIPLFIQFKLCDCMTRASAIEVAQGLLTCPFYRMHLRPARHSKQHSLLLDLEHSGQLVYYAAPAFHQANELDEAYLARAVVTRSVWIRPSAIGALPDGDDHYVSFHAGGQAYLCSSPTLLEASIDAGNMVERLSTELFQAKISQQNRFEGALQSLLQRTADESPFFETERSELMARLSNRHPVERLAFYSRWVLESQVYLVNRIES